MISQDLKEPVDFTFYMAAFAFFDTVRGWHKSFDFEQVLVCGDASHPLHQLSETKAPSVVFAKKHGPVSCQDETRKLDSPEIVRRDFDVVLGLYAPEQTTVHIHLWGERLQTYSFQSGEFKYLFEGAYALPMVCVPYSELRVYCDREVYIVGALLHHPSRLHLVGTRWTYFSETISCAVHFPLEHSIIDDPTPVALPDLRVAMISTTTADPTLSAADRA